MDNAFLLMTWIYILSRIIGVGRGGGGGGGGAGGGGQAPPII